MAGTSTYTTLSSCTNVVATTRHAMTRIFSALVLIAVASMASGSVLAPDGVEHGCPAEVTRFVCVKCTETGKISSGGLFLNQAAVHSRAFGRSTSRLVLETSRQGAGTLRDRYSRSDISHQVQRDLNRNKIDVQKQNGSDVLYH